MGGGLLGTRLVLLLRFSPGLLRRRLHVLVDEVDHHLVDQVLELPVSSLDLLAPDLAGLQRRFRRGLRGTHDRHPRELVERLLVGL